MENFWTSWYCFGTSWKKVVQKEVFWMSWKTFSMTFHDQICSMAPCHNAHTHPSQNEIPQHQDRQQKKCLGRHGKEFWMSWKQFGRRGKLFWVVLKWIVVLENRWKSGLDGVLGRPGEVLGGVGWGVVECCVVLCDLGWCWVRSWVGFGGRPVSQVARPWKPKGCPEE